MGFDQKGFRAAKFEDRTARVPVPDLAEWFEEGEEPVFVVRGLAGEEVAKCNEAVQKSKNVSAIVEALSTKNQKEKVQALREMLGVTESITNDLAKRLEQFAIGTVDPDLDHEMAVKFAQNYPAEFYEITNEIIRLTGLGREVAKKKSSGKTQK